MNESDIFSLSTAIGLLFFNGLFIAGQFAVSSLQKSRVQSLVKEGKSGAQTLENLLRFRDDFITAFQIGNFLTTLGIGLVGYGIFKGIVTALMKAFIHPDTGLGYADGPLMIVTFIVTLLLLTCVHAVLGVFIPKSVALAYSERVGLTMSKPFYLAFLALRPLAVVLKFISRMLLKPFRIELASASPRVHSEEEINEILDESRKAGLVSAGEREMLKNVFKFHDKTLKEIMVPRPDIVALDVRSDLETILKVVREEGFSRIPVYNGELDNIVGMINVKDLIYCLDHPKLIRLPDLLRDVLEYHETTSIAAILKDFQHSRIHMAIVVDEFGATAGLVTLEDVVEEIVGEIQDEHDEEEPEFELRPDGSWLVDCGASVSTFYEKLHIADTPDGDFDTVGGLILHLAGRLPKEGDQFALGNLRIRVTKREGRRLRKVTVRQADQRPKPPTSSEPENPLSNMEQEANVLGGRKSFVKEEHVARDLETSPTKSGHFTSVG